MLYLFFGEDTYRSRQGFQEFLEQESHNKSEFFSPLRFSPDGFDESIFTELLRAKNLFAEKNTVVCEGILENTDNRDFILNNLKFCSSSENLFIFLEETLESSVLALFKKYSQKIEEFKSLPSSSLRVWFEKELEARKISMTYRHKEELLRRSRANLWLLVQEIEKYHLTSNKTGALSDEGLRKEEINLFHIADAVAARDKARAWLLFQKSLILGLDPEEVFWKIVWQIKNNLIIKRLSHLSERKIAEITRLHPYVIKKTISSSRFFTEEELFRCSFSLVKLYHDSRRGLADFETGVEKFLIRL